MRDPASPPGLEPIAPAGAPSPTDRLLPVAPTEPASERKALGVVALLALALAVWIAHPVGFGVFLGALNAFMMQPVFERIRIGRHRSAAAAASTVALSTVALLGALVAVAYVLVSRGVALASTLIESLSPGGEGRARLDPWLGRLGLGAHGQDLLTRLHEAATELAARAAGVAAAIASTTMRAVLALFFAMLTTHFVLRHWAAMTRTLEDMLPLHPRHTRALLAEVRDAGRTTLLGTLVTGVAQGVFAGIGYAIAGLPEPAFFGAATAVASLVPAVGTLLVWIPAGLALLLAGHVVGGIVVLVWGSLVVVALSDYVVRPRLVGGHGHMPALLTLASLLGGVEALGLTGLLVGPVVMSIALAALRIYAAETAGRSAERERSAR
jgi:predicted PurR-regulated permease PerM